MQMAEVNLVEAASLESLLVFVVIILLSAASNWLKKRQGHVPDTWPEEPTPPRPMVPPQSQRLPGTPDPMGQPGHPRPAGEVPPKPRPMTDWEEELRKLLGEEVPTVTPRPIPTPAPPVVVHRTPEPMKRAAPPPILTAEEISESQGLPVPTRSRVRFPQVAPGSLDAAPAPAFELARMEESARASARAAAVHHDTGPSKNPAMDLALLQARKLRSPDGIKVVSMLRNHATLRQSFLASIVLGPPMAMERDVRFRV
jgi:hypothetical protein